VFALPCRYLNNNQISSLDSGVFDKSTGLTLLGLGFNKLQELPNDLFLYENQGLSITSLAEGNFLLCLPILPPLFYEKLDARTKILSTCPCNNGTYLDSWNTGCVGCLGSCSAGQELCPEGSNAPNECGDCPPGSYSTSGIQCLPCQVGTFQDAAGQTACKLCPSGSITIHQGSISESDCLCQAGYFHIAGSSSLLAGGGTESGGFDGVGDQAQFNLPGAIAISSDGTFAVVADTESHVIRILNMSNGETRLIAGSGTEGYEGWDKYSWDIITLEIANLGTQNEGFVGINGSWAKFSRPSGVALTPDDKYAIISDTGESEDACQLLPRRPGNINRHQSVMMLTFA
jgi:hypothetical protein